MPQATFVPGETRRNLEAGILIADEMVNLVDASLDFWLTTWDPWAHKFETRFNGWESNTAPWSIQALPPIWWHSARSRPRNWETAASNEATR